MNLYFNETIITMPKAAARITTEALSVLAVMERDEARELIEGHLEKLARYEGCIIVRGKTATWPEDPWRDAPLTSHATNILRLLWIAAVTSDLFSSPTVQATGYWSTRAHVKPRQANPAT